jgi:hypothetical protein
MVFLRITLSIIKVNLKEEKTGLNQLMSYSNI